MARVAPKDYKVLIIIEPLNVLHGADGVWEKGLRAVKPALHGVCTSVPGVLLPQFHTGISFLGAPCGLLY
jgi:hypothetical protein